MTGICGVVDLNKEHIDPKITKRMLNIISHRGPDNTEYYDDNNVSFGLNYSGKKTQNIVFNEDKSIVLLFDGFLYDTSKEKKRLEKKKHKFSTKQNHEVIVHLYEEYGKDFVKDLQGSFAFALWDSNQQKLFLARDKMGNNILFYTVLNNSLIFSSEAKSILLYPGYKTEVDLEVLHTYFSFRYWTPAYKTLFANINRILPSQRLEFNKTGLKSEYYYDISFSQIKKPENYLIKKFSDYFDNAVKNQAFSAEDPGLFLSGGIDSCAVLAYLKKHCNQEIKTYFVGFESDTPFDERKYSRMAADYFKTDHHEIFVTPEDIKYFPIDIWHIDDMCGVGVSTNSAYMLSCLAKKQKSKTIFMGLGAGEILGEEDSIRLKQIDDLMKCIPSALYNRFIPSWIYTRFTKTYTETELREFYTGYMNKRTLSLRSFAIEDTIKENTKKISHIVNKSLYVKQKVLLPNMLLDHYDKIFAVNALSMRNPFLDSNLVDLSHKLPLNLRLKGKNIKYILKKSMEGKMPKEIITRKKQNWQSPIQYCVKKQRHVLDHFVLEFGKRNYFETDKVKKLVNNYDGSLLKTHKLWMLFVLELWHKIFIDNHNIKKSKISLKKLW